ncbi:MAG: VanW family protein [Candidatus Levyibacteriota bacterium]
MFQTLISLILIPFLLGGKTPVVVTATHTLAAHAFSLEDRYGNSFVNNVFKDNILLAVTYATNKHVSAQEINWKQIENPFHKTIALKPGETFAFHDDVLPQYNGKVEKTTNAHFDSQEGFKSDGYLVGDGVCHLASLLYWVAKDAGLAALAPTRHDFAPVPDVPREYGVSIYDNAFAKGSSNELQNLYITNNKNKTIVFDFDYNGKNLIISAKETI